MNKFVAIIKNDYKYYIKYNILQTVVIISMLFAGVMAFFPRIDALMFIYVTTFILPVVLFSINIFIEKEERTLLPLVAWDYPTLMIILAKTLSALTLLMIPFVFYILVMYLVYHMTINIFLFLLVYILAVIIHVIIGTALAIISKSSSLMSLSYLGYIVVFSLVPIFYTSGLIPDSLEFVMVISPAYLSGVLFQEIYYGYSYSEVGLIVLSIVLQLIYIGALTFFVIRPYFKTYLLLQIKKGDSV